MFAGPEDYWLHSSPSSFNEDLRRKKTAGEGEKKMLEKKRGGGGGDRGTEEKVTKAARLSDKRSLREI